MGGRLLLEQPHLHGLRAADLPRQETWVTGQTQPRDRQGVGNRNIPRGVRWEQGSPLPTPDMELDRSWLLPSRNSQFRVKWTLQNSAPELHVRQILSSAGVGVGGRGDLPRAAEPTGV